MAGLVMLKTDNSDLFNEPNIWSWLLLGLHCHYTNWFPSTALKVKTILKHVIASKEGPSNGMESGDPLVAATRDLERYAA